MSRSNLVHCGNALTIKQVIKSGQPEFVLVRCISASLLMRPFMEAMMASCTTMSTPRVPTDASSFRINMSSVASACLTRAAKTVLRSSCTILRGGAYVTSAGHQGASLTTASMLVVVAYGSTPFLFLTLVSRKVSIVLIWTLRSRSMKVWSLNRPVSLATRSCTAVKIHYTNVYQLETRCKIRYKAAGRKSTWPHFEEVMQALLIFDTQGHRRTCVAACTR